MSDTVRPPCQTAGCEAEATELLRSKKTGMELHLCRRCASDYHTQGWAKIRGDVELINP